MYEIALTLSVIAIAFGLGVQVLPRIILNSTDSFAAVLASMLVDMTNTDRSTASLSKLTVNPLLQAAAQAKADDMAKYGYFAHTSPTGVTPWHWIATTGYDFAYAGENLAIDYFESADVESAWMNSPTHRANIMSGTFTEIGIATAIGTYNGHQTTFVVQMFGRPAKSDIISGTQNKQLNVIASSTTFTAVSR
jgi:uncharacterized protein YkwD